MTFQVTNKNCSTKNLKVNCDHTWNIPNFGDWLTNKADQMPLWLHGETFSPVSGCLLQLKIQAITLDNIKVYLKNCGNSTVTVKKCSFVMIASLKKSSIYGNLEQFNCEFENETLLTSKTLQYELNVDWHNRKGWVKRPGKAMSEQAISIQSLLSIGLNEDKSEGPLLKVEERSLTNDMEKLMINPSFSDWTLICEGEKISCH